jgi:MFS family permease
LRFAIFALAPVPALVVAINLIHGVCYAFFFASVYIFVDDFFPKDARASAQGLFNFLILGLGPFVANFVWPKLGDVFTTTTGPDFHKLFLVPAGVALLSAIGLFVFFRPGEGRPRAAPVEAVAVEP